MLYKSFMLLIPQNDLWLGGCLCFICIVRIGHFSSGRCCLTVRFLAEVFGSEVLTFKVPAPVATATPRHLLEMQTHRPLPRPTTREALGVELSSYSAGRSQICMLKFEKHWPSRNAMLMLVGSHKIQVRVAHYLSKISL